jgi:hypothetical protein
MSSHTYMPCVAVMVMLYIRVLHRVISRLVPFRVCIVLARHDTHKTSLWVSVQVETDVLVSVLCRQLSCRVLGGEARCGLHCARLGVGHYDECGLRVSAVSTRIPPLPSQLGVGVGVRAGR